MPQLGFIAFYIKYMDGVCNISINLQLRTGMVYDYSGNCYFAHNLILSSMKKLNALLLLSILLLASCKKEDTVHQYAITGSLQMTPFIKGATFFLFNHNRDNSHSDDFMHITIDNNYGKYEVPEIQTKDGIICICANGRFFNLITGDTTESRGHLSALVNIENNTVVNLNIITTLEMERVAYLYKEGWEFDSAKVQAQKEVLDIFGYQFNEPVLSESIDITKKGTQNSIALAITALLQANRTGNEVGILAQKIAVDISEDGILDNQDIRSEIRSQALALNTDSVQSNLSQWYKGAGYEENNFSSFIDNYLENSK